MPQSRSKRSRYTPPAPKKAPPSRLWLPVTMFTMLGAGMIVVVANYLGLLPGGDAQNSYLFIGLGLIAGGFLLSTRLR
ncbi:MAG: cell division protein CrgA [Acidimicrobiia bacterium]